MVRTGREGQVRAEGIERAVAIEIELDRRLARQAGDAEISPPAGSSSLAASHNRVLSGTKGQVDVEGAAHVGRRASGESDLVRGPGRAAPVAPRRAAYADDQLPERASSLSWKARRIYERRFGQERPVAGRTVQPATAPAQDLSSTDLERSTSSQRPTRCRSDQADAVEPRQARRGPDRTMSRISTSGGEARH